MKNYFKLFLFVFILLTLTVFKNWFFLNPLSSGDWSYNFSESIKTFTIFPYSWFFNLNAGLGGTSLFILSLSSYFLFTTSFLFNFFKIPWVLIERLVWFWPFLLISAFSSYFLFKKLFSEKFALLSSFIFLFNSYILMIVGGGQMGVAFAYAMAPLVLYVFIKTIDFFNFSKNNIQFSIFNFQLPLLSGLLFSILVLFDLRIAYICITSVMLYLVLNIKYKVSKNNFLRILNLISYSLIIPAVITFLLNSFWIIPLIAGGKNPLVELGSVYSSLESVKFFSFAKFENSIGLLHPNWPENIFGKVGFMRPEFLFLPVLAYASLFFAAKIKDSRLKTYVIYFALLGLIGAFLAKGVNEPFGRIYLWLFNHFTGFVMFRDPTKWYTLVAVSYSVLIPFTVWKSYEWLKSQSKFQISNFKFQIRSKSQILNFQNLFFLLVTGYLLFLIRPAFFGQLTGTFKPHEIPKDYIRLEEFLSSKKDFFRILWVPEWQRFGFFSNNHPAIGGGEIFKKDAENQIKQLKQKGTEGLLEDLSVKYIIIPYDSEKEIFLRDRKYDDKLYEKSITETRKIKWLREIDGFGKIKVFEVPNPKDHFWSPSTNLQVKYRYVNPTKYEVYVKNAKKGDLLVFSEGFDKYWIAKNTEFRIQNSPASPSEVGRRVEFDKRLNSFVLPKDGSYSLEIYYTLQKWVNIGLVISGLSFFSAIIYIIFGLIPSKMVK